MNGPDRFDEVYELMRLSFPEIEYREYNDQKKLLEHPAYVLLTETDDAGMTAGFLAGWLFDTFAFVEHIAVSPHIRGGGIGKRLMESFMKQAGKPVILEVEIPEDELQRRRIGFYERLGFHLNDYPYFQPPLRTGQPALPLRLMSYPEPLTVTQLDRAKAELYTEVYHWPVQRGAQDI